MLRLIRYEVTKSCRFLFDFRRLGLGTEAHSTGGYPVLETHSSPRGIERRRMACVPHRAGGRRCRGSDPQSENRQGTALPHRRPGGRGAGAGCGRAAAGRAGRDGQRARHRRQLAMGGLPELSECQGREETEEGQEADSNQGRAGGIGHRQEDRVRQNAAIRLLGRESHRACAASLSRRRGRPANSARGCSVRRTGGRPAFRIGPAALRPGRGQRTESRQRQRIRFRQEGRLAGVPDRCARQSGQRRAAAQHDHRHAAIAGSRGGRLQGTYVDGKGRRPRHRARGGRQRLRGQAVQRGGVQRIRQQRVAGEVHLRPENGQELSRRHDDLSGAQRLLARRSFGGDVRHPRGQGEKDAAAGGTRRRRE